MKALAPLVVGTMMTANAAFATGGIYCEGVTEEAVSVYLIVGSTPGFGVVGADITTPDAEWRTLGEGDVEEITLVQASIAGDFVVADFADANVENIVASLRLVRVENDLGFVGAGVLSTPDGGAWSVACDFD